MKLFTVILLLLFSISCTSKNSNDDALTSSREEIYNLTAFTGSEEPLYNIQFEEGIIIGEDNNDSGVYYDYNRTIDVDDQDRIYLGSKYQIHVFDESGDYLTTLGRQGEGPGEFIDTFIHPKLYSDRVISYDFLLKRINVFSSESFDFLYSINISPESWEHIDELIGYSPAFGNSVINNNGTFLLEFRENIETLTGRTDNLRTGLNLRETEHRYMKLDLNGTVDDDDIIFRRAFNRIVYVVDDGRTIFYNNPPSFTTPFFRNSLMAVSQEGEIYLASTEEFLIKVYDPEGNYLRAFSYPYTKTVLGDITDITLGNSDIKLEPDIFEHMTIPDSWPALHSMLIDDENRLWISTITEEEDSYLWWILDNHGQLLTKFSWPTIREWADMYSGIKMIKNGSMYYYHAYERDDSTAIEDRIPRMIKYEFTLEEL